jgi:hypothetical protein
VIAAETRCVFPGNAPCGRFRVYSAPATRDRWRPVTGASGTQGLMGAAPRPVVTAAAGTGFVTATAAGFGGAQQPPALLTGAADGSARWHRLVTPCAKWAAVQVAATPGLILALGCTDEPGAGNQVKRVHLGGVFGPSMNVACQGGDSLSAVITTDTQGFTLEPGASPGKLWLTYDGAHTWHLVSLH